MKGLDSWLPCRLLSYMAYLHPSVFQQHCQETLWEVPFCSGNRVSPLLHILLRLSSSVAHSELALPLFCHLLATIMRTEGKRCSPVVCYSFLPFHFTHHCLCLTHHHHLDNVGIVLSLLFNIVILCWLIMYMEPDTVATSFACIFSASLLHSHHPKFII